MHRIHLRQVDCTQQPRFSELEEEEEAEEAEEEEGKKS
jgi:hypothetical protein